MKAFRYARTGLEPSEARLERALQMVPGALSWSILATMVLLSFLRPAVAAALVIAFYIYWLFRLFYLTLFLILSYGRLEAEQETDWMARARGLDDLQAYIGRLQAIPPPSSLRKRLSLAAHRRQVERLSASGATVPALDSIYHAVLYPIAREGREVYEPGVRRLLEQDFPAERVMVVLAVEERAAQTVREQAEAVAAAYRGKFLDVILSVHPDNVPGEARVKGANVTCAGRKAAAELKRRGIPLENAILSCFDADTIIDHNYLSCLTYAFMVHPDRLRCSFQPVPVYHNNIWEVPGFARVLDVGASFFQLIEATNPEKLVTFSSHSMSFQALDAMGYWPVDLISDDSAVYWKALVHFGGEYRAVPLYTTASMDVVTGANWWQTAVGVYKQKRRWAWGVENFPILVRGFMSAERIPLSEKVRHLFKMLEGHVSWATWPFLLTGIGWLPGLVAGREFATSVMYYTAPRIAATIFNLASAALLATIILSLMLLPRPRGRYALLRQIVHIAEWLFIPLIALVFSGTPALDAQTRLMLGRRMAFWVAGKRGRA